MSTRTDTRERMVAGAKTLMRRHGFGATSLKDVWEFTQTPRGSVYFHFPEGKLQLGIAVLDSTVDTLFEWTDNAEKLSTGVADFIVELGKQLADFLEDSGYDEGCPIASVAIEMSPTSPVLREAASDAIAKWSERIACVLSARGVKAAEAPELAKAVTAAFEGAILVSKSDHSREALELVASLIARGLSP